MSLTRLPILERVACVAIWTFAVMYGMYNTYLAADNLCRVTPIACDLEPGLWFMNRNVDRGRDWSVNVYSICRLLPWWFLHLLGADVIRCFRQQYLSTWYLLIATIFTMYMCGMSTTLYLFAHPCVFYILLQLRSKILVWLISFLGCYYLYFVIETWTKLFGLQRHGQISEMTLYDMDMLFGLTCWIYMRCLSFTLDHINPSSAGTTRADFVKFLAYVFYLPLMFTGPLMLYDQFHKGLEVPHQRWTQNRVVSFCFELTRYLIWTLITDLALHFIYISGLQNHSQILEQIDSWALFGLTWTIAFYFMLTYICVYGLPGVFARAELYHVSKPPACVARIHLYSDMWKLFDRGLYLFLVRYIYVPCIGNKKGLKAKVFASFACFCFVYVFHGATTYVLVWTVLNFVEVSLEGLGKAIISTPLYQQVIRGLSEENVRRLSAAIAAPLMTLSIISNMYYLGMGMKFGNVFVSRFLWGGWSVTLTALGLAYCASQTAMEYRRSHKVKKQT